MAGEPSLFLVYQDFNANERTNGSWHGTQAAADVAANDGGSDSHRTTKARSRSLTDGEPNGSITRSTARGA